MGQQAVYDAQGNIVNPDRNNIFSSDFWNPSTGFTYDPTQFASAYQNINPYSAQVANSLFGGNVSNFINQGLGYTPGQGFETFMSQQANPLANLVSGQMSPLEQSLTNRANILSNQAVNNVLDRFAGMNATYSTAALNNAMEAGSAPFADVANILGQQQLGLTGNLWGQQLGLAQQNALNQSNLAQNLLGMQTGFGDLMMTAPDMMTTGTGAEDLWGGAMDIAGLGANLIPLI